MLLAAANVLSICMNKDYGKLDTADYVVVILDIALVAWSAYLIW